VLKIIKAFNHVMDLCGSWSDVFRLWLCVLPFMRQIIIVYLDLIIQPFVLQR